MHHFLHGIRRSFLRPVWAPLQRCLPLLALLNCCPEDGKDLLPLTQLKQPFGYGDLLPTSGEEDEGDLLPNSGVDEDGEGIPPSQGNEPEIKLDLPPPLQVGQHADVKGYPPPLNGEANQQIKSTLAAAEYINLQSLHGEDAVLLLPRSGDEATERNLLPFLHHGQDDEEGSSLADSVKLNLLPHLQPAPNAGQSQQVGALSPMKGDDGVVEPYPHRLPPWVMLIPRPRVKMKGTLPLYNNAHTWEHDVWACPPSPSTSSLLLNLFTTKLPDKLPVLTIPSTPLRGSVHIEDGVPDFFLIPLRGRRCNQWNDEEFVEDAAAQKMKTKRRMMVLRLFYLMKDLLDPG